MRLTIFASGSTGNCALLEAGGQHFLLDAGLSAKAIREALCGAGCPLPSLSGILITHEHSDHVSGLSALCRRDPLTVYAPGTVATHISWSYPGVDSCLHRVTPEQPFAVGGVTLCCFPTPHDTPQSVGWRIEAEDGVFALATDTGHVTDTMHRYLSGADIAVIEANHDEQMLRYGPYPAALKRRVLSERGHLSNADCAVLARELAESGTRHIVLGHLSRQNNRPQLAREAVAPVLAGFDTNLYIAPEKGALVVEETPCFA